MTVGEIREILENSKDPVYVIQGEDYRFRTYNPIGMSTPWDKLPNALKIIFALLASPKVAEFALQTLSLFGEVGGDYNPAPRLHPN